VTTPARIGRYAVQGELGRGAMGVVYRAHDARLRRDVAVKLAIAGGDRGRLLRRLSVEAVALGRLRHPGIVTLHEVGEHEGHPFLVMDLVEGRSLQDRLDQGGPLPPLEAARIARQLALALAHAHERGVLHRDVKPTNVLLPPEGPVLTDFGLARDADLASGVTTPGHVLGTPGFWPPEQARGKRDQVGPASDVYALGATLFAALTGRPPFEGETLLETVAATCQEPPPPPSSLAPGVGPGLDAIVLRALEKAPADRFPSAQAMAEALERWLVAGDPRPARARPRRPGGAGLIGGLGLLALAVVAVAGALLIREQHAAEAQAQPPTPPPAPSPPTTPSPPPPASSTTPAPATTPAPVAPVPPDAPPRVTEVQPPAQPPPAGEAPRDAFARGLTLELHGRFALAAAEFDRALAGAPDLAAALVHRARCRAALADPNGAEADLLRAIALHGAWDPTPWFTRGALRDDRGDAKGGAEDLARAAALAPDCLSVVNRYAVALMGAGRRPDALAVLDGVIRAHPTSWVAWYYRGWARRREGDLLGAQEDLTRAVTLSAAADMAWYERARVRLLLDDLEGARSDASRALDLDPANADAWDVRAEARGRLGDARGMEGDETQVLRLTPDEADPYADRATARLLLRNPAGALEDLGEGLRRSPRWAFAYGQQGRVRALLGDREGAVRDLRRALELDPGDRYSPLWLAGLGAPDQVRLEAVASGDDLLAAVARRFLGAATDDEVLAAAERAPKDAPTAPAAAERARRERLCVARGFLGLRAERDGDLALAKTHYDACLAQRCVMWAQHMWAWNRRPALGP
jgi:serine/threonine protein kinase/tetratricopeptide (TPR) repeat protein